VRDVPILQVEVRPVATVETQTGGETVWHQLFGDGETGKKRAGFAVNEGLLDLRIPVWPGEQVASKSAPPKHQDVFLGMEWFQQAAEMTKAKSAERVRRLMLGGGSSLRKASWIVWVGARRPTEMIARPLPIQPSVYRESSSRFVCQTWLSKFHITQGC
jgi:hypothetical protein